MTENDHSRDVLRQAPVLHRADPVEAAVRAVLDSRLPALPVVDEHERLVGIFGEREFMGALFPGYLSQLSYAGFIPHSLDDAIQRQASCRTDAVAKHMNTEHIDVGTDFSDTQVAEVFLHHRVLIIPVVGSGEVLGVITRSDFFRSIAERFLSPA